MKIIEVYGKEELAKLEFKGKNILTTMDEFFNNHPEYSSYLYYRNLESLKSFRLDQMKDRSSDAKYDYINNILYFTNFFSIGHELFHVASGGEYSSAISECGFEEALEEGMTENLFMQAFGLNKPSSYFFEVFCVEMLKDVPDLFKPYFLADPDMFINLFPNKKDIYGLMYALSYYNDVFSQFNLCKFERRKFLFDNKLMCDSIKDVIDCLISIELSIEKDPKKLREYRDKFMDLISSKDVFCDLKSFDKHYLSYCEREFKRRVKR